jgi:hypothetical protein
LFASPIPQRRLPRLLLLPPLLPWLGVAGAERGALGAGALYLGALGALCRCTAGGLYRGAL